jgi:FkbM family methyltransferase
MQIFVNQLTDATGLYHTYKWENKIWKYLLRELKPGDIYWDVGANIGFYTLLASSRPDVKVVAFEPNPTTEKFLSKNVELNRRSNVKVFNIALSNAEGTAKFDTIHPGSSDVAAHLTNKETEGAIDVITKRGDKLINSGEAPTPDIIKIDVEGAEYLVMEGMGNTLSKCRIVICELHPTIEDFGNSMEDFYTYLKKERFNIEYREQFPGFYAFYVIAKKSK